jgi:hypothetical protein
MQSQSLPKQSKKGTTIKGCVFIRLSYIRLGQKRSIRENTLAYYKNVNCNKREFIGNTLAENYKLKTSSFFAKKTFFKFS